MAAFIKDGAARRILIENWFFAPQNTAAQLTTHWELIARKSGLDTDELHIITTRLLGSIIMIPQPIYDTFIAQAGDLIDDPEDVPFLALALTVNADILSDDKHFQEQNHVKVWTTKELLGKAL